jgi:hypothetical protein
MRSPTPLMALVLASLSASACIESSPTGSSSASAGPPLSLSNAPSASGPIVIRSISGYFPLAILDASHGLFAIHIARNGFAFCGEPFTLFHPGQFQDVFNPANADLVHELFRAEGVFTSVYAWAGQDIGVRLDGGFEDEAKLCDFLLTTTPLAQGTARVVRTDNNLLGVPDRMDTFGFTAEGRLTLSSGGLAHYNGSSRVVLLPPDRVKVSARINLVPRQ